MSQSLADNFRALGLPPPAAEWLLMVWQVIQVLDDVADGDKIERADLDAAIWNSVVGFYQSPFFQQHWAILVPVLAGMVLKWKASDVVERAGHADAKSYMWRAGYYDLVLAAMQIVHGAKIAMDNAHLVMRLYGETYEDYRKEFSDA